MTKKAKPTVANLMMAENRRKPDFIAEPNMDQVVDVVLRLAMEINVLRERLDIHEALAAKHGYGGSDAIEQYQPDESLVATQAARRELLIARILDDLK